MDEPNRELDRTHEELRSKEDQTQNQHEENELEFWYNSANIPRSIAVSSLRLFGMITPFFLFFFHLESVRIYIYCLKVYNLLTICFQAFESIVVLVLMNLMMSKYQYVFHVNRETWFSRLCIKNATKGVYNGKVVCQLKLLWFYCSILDTVLGVETQSLCRFIENQTHHADTVRIDYNTLCRSPELERFALVSSQKVYHNN